MRHVGDELGLVLRRNGQLGGLLLEEALGLFDLLVPVGRLAVPIGKEAGLTFEACVGRWDCFKRVSVRAEAWIVLRTIPMLAVTESRKVWWVREKGEKEANSITAWSDPSNRTGRRMMLSGGDSPRPELILT